MVERATGAGCKSVFCRRSGTAPADNEANIYCRQHRRLRGAGIRPPLPLMAAAVVRVVKPQSWGTLLWPQWGDNVISLAMYLFRLSGTACGHKQAVTGAFKPCRGFIASFVVELRPASRPPWGHNAASHNGGGKFQKRTHTGNSC